MFKVALYQILLSLNKREIICYVCMLCFCSRVMTYREHGAWVVKAHLQKETDGNIISVR